jgi:hypothetical protein
MSRNSEAHLFFGFEIKSDDDISKIDRDMDCKRVSVGDDDESQHFLTAIALEAGIWGVGPTAVNPADPVQKETEARDRLRNYCTKHGIEFQEPSWHLAASYN